MLTTEKKKDLIVLSGLEESGKTMLFYRLVVNDVPTDKNYIKTLGYNSDTWQPTESKSYTLWDFGGVSEVLILILVGRWLVRWLGADRLFELRTWEIFPN